MQKLNIYNRYGVHIFNNYTIKLSDFGHLVNVFSQKKEYLNFKMLKTRYSSNNYV